MLSLHKNSEKGVFHITRMNKLRIGNTIAFLAMKVPKLSKTALMKLLWLLEEEHFKLNNELFSGLEFKAFKNGPVPVDVYYDIIYRNRPNYKKNFVGTYFDVLPKDEFGMGFPSYDVIVPVEDFKFNPSIFSKRELNSLDKIIFKYGNLPAYVLIDITHSIGSPWERTVSENQIDFSATFTSKHSINLY